MIGKHVIVRTYSAGVHAGILKSRDGKEAVLTDARRIWYWDGAATLSQLAIDGTARDEARQSPDSGVKRRHRRQLGLEFRPLGGGVDRQALVEESDDDGPLFTFEQKTPEGRRHWEPPFWVNPVVVSPFQHRELGVFHTFIHFSTPLTKRPPDASRVENVRPA